MKRFAIFVEGIESVRTAESRRLTTTRALARLKRETRTVWLPAKHKNARFPWRTQPLTGPPRLSTWRQASLGLCCEPRGVGRDAEPTS
jgi:hypothetical protein